MKAAFRFSDEVFRSTASLPLAGESIGYRHSFQQKIAARPSLLFRSAVESIDAAFGLLALGQVSQAFLLLAQATEVSLKATIDEFNRLGISAWAAQNPVLFRNRAGNDLPLDKAKLQEIVAQRHFLDVFREVSTFVEFSDGIESSCYQINSTRNDIAHRGGDPQRVRFYLEQTILKVLPLLDEFYYALTGSGLCDLIMHDVARELIVAGRFLRSRGPDAGCLRMALRPVSAAYFHHRTIEHGAPPDQSGLVTGSDLARESEWERTLAGSLKGNVLDQENTRCHICGERCFLATNGVLKRRDGAPYFDISAMACTYCNLRIPEEYSDLAIIHYGPIDEHLLGHDDWVGLVRSFGYDPSASQET
jgi:hypothetical protein